MTNMVAPDGKTMMSGYSTTNNSGFNGIVYSSGNYTMYTGGTDYPEEKYYDKYSFYDGDRTVVEANKNSKLGDATKEVRNTISSNWYNDISYSVTANAREWFVRGGYWYEGNPTRIGIFSLGSMSGTSLYNTATRAIIIVN